MPNSVQINTKQLLWALGLLTSVAVAVFAWGWNLSAVAGNVERNTQAIDNERVNTLRMRNKMASQETILFEQVLKAQGYERRITILEKRLDNKLDLILRKLDK